jgi:hypothetical protein
MTAATATTTTTSTNAGDVVSETNATASHRRHRHVYSTLSAYTLGTNVENGRILATGAANLTGNTLNNLLYAGAGNNVLNGSTGTDTVSYVYGLRGVTVSLATHHRPGHRRLRLRHPGQNIENLTGSNYNDRLTGNTGANLPERWQRQRHTDRPGRGRTSSPAAPATTPSTSTPSRRWAPAAPPGTSSPTSFAARTRSTWPRSMPTRPSPATRPSRHRWSAGPSPAPSPVNNPAALYFDTVAHVLYGNTDADAAAEFALQLTGMSTLAASDLFL